MVPSVHDQPRLSRIKFKRCDSLVITSYPWVTDTVVSHANLTEFFGENHVLKNFLVALQKYEQVDLSQHELLGFELREALHHFTNTELSNGTITGFNNRKPSTKVAGLCLTYICAHRLVDVTSWVEGLPTNMKVPRHRSQGTVGKVPLQKWNLLNDWPNLLVNCHSFFANGVQSNQPDVSSMSPGNQYLYLLSSIALRDEKSKEMNIASNIEIAAMHISIMWKGLLDFPDDAGWFRSQCDSDQMDSKSMDFLEKHLYKSKTSLHRFKLPLHLALIISPLILLLPIQLQSKDWDRYALLLMPKALGNQRPNSLTDAEKTMWKCIFAIVRGERTSLDSIKDMLTRLPVDLLDNISDADRRWFLKSQDAITSAIQDSPLKLHEADVEHPLPTGWPPLQLLHNKPRTKGIRSTAGEILTTIDEVGLSRRSTDPMPCTNSDSIREGDEQASSIGPLSPIPYAPPSERMSSTTQPPTTVSSEQAGAFSSTQDNTRPESIRPGDVQASNTQLSITVRPEQPIQALEASAQANNSASNPRRSLRTKPSTAVESGKHPPAPKHRKGPPRPLSKYGSKYKQSSAFPPNAVSSIDVKTKSQSQPSKHESKHEQGPTLPSNAGCSREHPINIETIFFYLRGTSSVPTLVEDKTSVETIRCPSQTFYDPYCKKVTTVMEFHSKARVDQYLKLVDAIESSFMDGAPLHLSNETSSMFFVIAESSPAATKSMDLQRIRTGRQHIIITGISTPKLAFDEDGLETLKSIEAVIDIYDFSHGTGTGVNLHNDESYLRKGSLSEMLESPGSRSSKILSTSEIPLGLIGIPSAFFSTDLYAWRQTEGHPFCNILESYPADSMRWGMAATKGTLRSWQLAPNGFGHYIEVQAGSILMVIARPKIKHPNDRDPFSNINLYGGKFDPVHHNSDLWDLEAVVLSSGTRLVLKPNTPYRYLFLENSICYGGLFYSTHTLQDTLSGMIHGFFFPSLIAGSISYPLASRHLLQRMLYFYYNSFVVNPSSGNKNLLYHLPNLLETKSIIDLLSLYVIITLLNVLDPATYSYPDLSLQPHDQNALSPEERLACMFARGKAENLLTWLLDAYEFVNPNTGGILLHPFEQIILPHIVELEATILAYKTLMDEKQAISSSFTSSDLKDQLSSALCQFNRYEIANHRCNNDPSLRKPHIWLDWDYPPFNLRPKSKRPDIESDIDFISDGTNWSDSLYKRFQGIPHDLFFRFSSNDCEMTNKGNSHLKRHHMAEKEGAMKKRKG